MNLTLFNIIQMVLGVVLILLILLQVKGAGLGSIGGDFSFYSTKRGAEKILFRLTIIVAFAFLLSSLFGVIASR